MNAYILMECNRYKGKGKTRRLMDHRFTLRKDLGNGWTEPVSPIKFYTYTDATAELAKLN